MFFSTQSSATATVNGLSQACLLHVGVVCALPLLVFCVMNLGGCNGLGGFISDDPCVIFSCSKLALF